MTIDDVRALLKKRCDTAGGLRAFSRMHGISAQHVSNVLRGKKPALGARLCDALGIEPTEQRWVMKRK